MSSTAERGGGRVDPPPPPISRGLDKMSAYKSLHVKLLSSIPNTAATFMRNLKMNEDEERLASVLPEMKTLIGAIPDSPAHHS